jgi:hypothetical protein
MLSSMILLYFTVFVFFQWGQRVALTSIDTKTFIILILLTWILIKSIT